MKKGKIKNTGELKLESDEQQWQLLLNGLINEIKTSALIELDDKTIRIKLVIREISAPHQRQVHTACRVQGNADEAINQGISRINSYLDQMLERSAWIFIAYINGERKLPVIIAYYPILKLFIYSLKKDSEAKQNFIPTYMQN